MGRCIYIILARPKSDLLFWVMFPLKKLSHFRVHGDEPNFCEEGFMRWYICIIVLLCNITQRDSDVDRASRPTIDLGNSYTE